MITKKQSEKQGQSLSTMHRLAEILKRGQLSEEQLLLISYILANTDSDKEREVFCELFQDLIPAFKDIENQDFQKTIDDPEQQQLYVIATKLIQDEPAIASSFMLDVAQKMSLPDLCLKYPSIQKYLSMPTH